MEKKPYAKYVEEACKVMEDATLKEETIEMSKMKVMRAEPWGLKKYAKEGGLYSVRSTGKVRCYMPRRAACTVCGTPGR